MTAVLLTFLIASLCVVAYAYVGYPIVLSLLARRHVLQAAPPGILPTVSLVIPMHNEAAVIIQKIENTAGLDYPDRLLEVIVIDDGSTDDSSQLAREVLPAGWRLITNQLRAGKPSILNQAVDAAQGQIVMLSDADTWLPPDSVKAMARHFHTPGVGAVTGEVRMADVEGPGAAEAGYWRYENGIKYKQSRLGMVMGGSGGTVAFRRDLYSPLEPDCLVDEYLILLRIALAGHAVRAEPRATAVHRATPSIRTEFRRRVRIVCGGWQSIVRTRAEAARAERAIQFHYISHRVLRWAVAPYGLLLAVVCLVALSPQLGVARYGLLLCVAGLFASGLGALAVATRFKVPGTLLLPFMVVFLNAAGVVGLISYLTGTQSVSWARPPRRRRQRGRLTIDVHEDADEIHVLLAGDLAGRGADALHEAWPELQQRQRPVWLDFSGVRRWDVRGLARFVTVLGQAHDAQVEVNVSSIPAEALNAASLAGLTPNVLRREEGPRITGAGATRGQAQRHAR